MATIFVPQATGLQNQDTVACSTNYGANINTNPSSPKKNNQEENPLTPNLKIVEKKKKTPATSLAPATAEDFGDFCTEPALSIAGAGTLSENEFAREMASKCRSDQFYTRSEDKKGHDETLRARVPKWWLGQIAHVVDKIPAYSSSSDLVRDAVYHRVCYLILHNDEIDPAVLAPFLSDRESQRAIQEIESMRSSLDGIRSTVRAYEGSRDWAGMFVYLDRQRVLARTMREPYRRRFLREIEDLIEDHRLNLSREERRKRDHGDTDEDGE